MYFMVWPGTSIGTPKPALKKALKGSVDGQYSNNNDNIFYLNTVGFKSARL